MTDIKNYSRIIDEIFGVGTTTFDFSKDVSNNVIVYLNPNAVKRLRGSLQEDFIRRLHNVEYDDFEYDNY